jgi:DNA-binding NtrC family response regulator
VEERASGTGTFGLHDHPHEGALRVILWDERQSNGQKISDIIRTAGAEPVLIEALSDLRLINCCAECCIAVTVMGPQPTGIGMQAIRDLKAKGFKVIACEKGAGSWPIKAKCIPLLAGAVQFLDTQGADFPRTLHQVIEGIVRAEAQKRSEESEVKATMRRMGMVGESAAMLRVFCSVIRFSVLSDLPVLITGETGTGKEGLAQALHRLDPKRNQGPFVAVNCGAINAGLVESELFGHRRGAFTGAERERKGLVRSAESGVLFLDEIADMELALQTRLLRVLQENRVLSVGEDREAKVNVRVVAASNRDLEQMIRQNVFRADLFHRLNVLSIHVPPLRDRPDDLRPLLEHFLRKYQSLALAGVLTAGTDFLEALRQVELPGNARQLENLVRQVLVCKATNSPLSISDLPVEILLQLSGAEEGAPTRKSSLDLFDSQTPADFVVSALDAYDWNLTRVLETCERHALEAAMGRTQGNQSQTARLLGITSRSVYNKVRKYRLKSESIFRKDR